MKRRVLIALAVVLGIGSAGLAAAAPAAAVTTPIGHLDRATQDAHGVLLVGGWAVDPGNTRAAATVDIVADARMVVRMPAAASRPDVDRALGITGNHGFTWSGTRSTVHVLSVVVHPVVAGEAPIVLATVYLNGYRPPTTAGSRIVAQAARLVGAPYAYGGAGPGGFDCSGYTSYVYSAAHVANLAHNSETQRHQVRIIPAAQARPGDLIFYMSGGTAYHVAIYAGGGTRAFTGYQYAATVPGEGVRYQHIWSDAIQYGTDWH